MDESPAVPWALWQTGIGLSTHRDWRRRRRRSRRKGKQWPEIYKPNLINKIDIPCCLCATSDVVINIIIVRIERAWTHLGGTLIPKLCVTAHSGAEVVCIHVELRYDIATCARTNAVHYLQNRLRNYVTYLKRIGCTNCMECLDPELSNQETSMYN